MADPFDGSPAASAATFNKVIYGDGVNNGLCLVAFAIYYDGANWQVGSAGTGVNADFRAEIESLVSWNVSGYLKFDFSGTLTEFRGWSGIPMVMAHAVAAGTRNMPCDGIGVSATEARIYFYDQTDRTTLETTENTAMNCYVIMIGEADV